MQRGGDKEDLSSIGGSGKNAEVRRQKGGDFSALSSLKLAGGEEKAGK